MARNHRAFLIIAIIAATTAAPGSPVAPGSPATRPKPVGVLSASFVSPSTGWLLAEPQCADLVYPCGLPVLMRKTVNGGRTWFAVPAPPSDMFQSSPPPDGVGQILFTSTRDGWAIGPAALWRTTDGGATWSGAIAAVGGWLTRDGGRDWTSVTVH